MSSTKCVTAGLSVLHWYKDVGLKIQRLLPEMVETIYIPLKIFNKNAKKISMVHYHNLSWYGTIVYHGLPVSIYRGSTMVYPGKMHGILWYTMVYQFQNTMAYRGIPCVLPWFTSFKIPW